MPDSLYWVYTLLGLVMANVVFLVHRISYLMCLWLFFGSVFIAIGIGIESRYGIVQDKAFSFYVILFLLFTILSYPGFVLRFLKKR
jgi:Protein of unknown function (DUF2818)